MKELQGTGVFNGVVVGPVYFYTPGRCAVSDEKVTDVEPELARFEIARLRAQRQLKNLYDQALAQAGEESAAIFDIHQMMLDDQDYIDSVHGLIEKGHDNAARAVQKTGARFARVFSEMDDEYMQARSADVLDISRRVIQILCGAEGETPGLEVPSIILADDLTPSQSMQFEREKVLAFATAKGSACSHMAILSRTKAIPAIVGLGEEANAQWHGKTAILDGEKGLLLIEPDEDTLAQAKAKIQQQEQEAKELEALKGTEDRTHDGREIKLFANVGNVEELKDALARDARGVGLFRTEFLYLQSSDYPSEEEQFRVYRQAAQLMNGKKIIFRTLDIGADKNAPYFDLPKEDNPALGLRAVRLCLARPDLFKTQLRALLRASVYGNVSIMYPMITSVSEVMQVKEMVGKVKEELRAEQVPFNEHIETGIMIETPAAALVSDELAPLVDFFSVGTNDLTQYTCALDRQNQSLDRFLDIHHPAVLRLIELAAKNAHAAGKWIGICGELGGDLTLTETFLKMGIDELSVSAPKVLPLRRKIQSL
ncbi:MAG: phosphoenolpyruvate--protein phosphotransferase [Elusimicrobiaceae bacterium]|nr:phosphoenolpyruvate--protein phosphotransferase [Elusimicrobiaceae bacterium]